MKPFNVDLYARSAEQAMRRIAAAKALDADDLRAIAHHELAVLKVRYRHNGHIGMQPDQREAQAKPSPSTGKAT
jgi:hypothetical protein